MGNGSLSSSYSVRKAEGGGNGARALDGSLGAVSSSLGVAAGGLGVVGTGPLSASAAVGAAVAAGVGVGVGVLGAVAVSVPARRGSRVQPSGTGAFDFSDYAVRRRNSLKKLSHSGFVDGGGGGGDGTAMVGVSGTGMGAAASGGSQPGHPNGPGSPLQNVSVDKKAFPARALPVLRCGSPRCCCPC